MIWYWVIFGILCLLSWCEQFSNIFTYKSKRIICFAITLFWIFISSIRWNQTLGDWKGYNQVYEWINISSFREIFQVNYWYFEPLYYMVMRIVKYCLDDYIYVQIFMVGIAIGGFYIASKYLEETTVSNTNNETYGAYKNNFITVYLVFWSTNCANIFTVRTNMALAICFIAIRYIENRKPIKFLIVVFVATCIHFSALVFLMAYPLYHMKFNVNKFIKFLVALAALSLIGVEKLLKIVALLGGRYAEKAIGYSTESLDQYSYLNYSTSFVIVKGLLNLGVTFFICLIVYKARKDDLRFNGLMNLYLIGVLIWLVTSQFNIDLIRIATFFTGTQFFIIPYIINIFKKRFNKLLVYFVFVAYMATKLYSLLASADGYSTFTTIFS